MDTSKLDLIHGACQPALNGGLVGLFNPTTVGFLTNAPISPDAPRLVLLCFVKKQYQTRGIGFKKPTPRKGAGRSAFLGKTRDFESSVEALIEVGSVFKMGHLQFSPSLIQFILKLGLLHLKLDFKKALIGLEIFQGYYIFYPLFSFFLFFVLLYSVYF